MSNQRDECPLNSAATNILYNQVTRKSIARSTSRVGPIKPPGAASPSAAIVGEQQQLTNGSNIRSKGGLAEATKTQLEQQPPKPKGAPRDDNFRDRLLDAIFFVCPDCSCVQCSAIFGGLLAAALLTAAFLYLGNYWSAARPDRDQVR